MIHNLWPTKVVIETLPLEECMLILNSHVSNSTKDWEDIVEKRFENLLLDIVNSYYGGKHEICEGWIRTLSTKEHNDFELHSDSHYGGQLVAVFQVSGDEDSGGELVLYDPSWNNPQWVSDTKNRNSNTFTVPFQMGKLIVFPANVWHRVNSYTGNTNRVTLNLILKKLS
jgi:hypothetical protein